MAKNSMEYSDIFCQAVQNIVNGSVSNLNFDMSKECTITKIINKSYGRYEVYDGSISFEAVATEGSTYQVGDSVMVTIPQGDSNKQIIILNKIIDEWTGPAGFVRPLDTLVSCTGNIAFNNHKQQSLIANGSQSLINVLTLKRQKFFGFQRIGVSAKFRSLLNNLGVAKGDYGLMFTIIQKSNNQDIADSIKQYKFSCSDMLGNPYAFNTYFKQEYAFDIDSSITQINELYVDFYQDAKFKDGNDNLIEATEYANLFIKDLEIYFGYPQDKEISEVVEIYSDNFEYSGNGLGTKQAYLQWIHKTDDYHLEHITKEEYFKENSPYEVRWYQYTSGCDDSKTDEYGGKHWELLNKVRPSSSSVNYPFEFVINVRPTYTEEKVKVVCLVRTHPLTNDPTYEQITRFDSNILTFQNLQEEAGEDAPPQEVLQKNLSLHFHDNSYGNYFLYDQNGRLIDGTNQGESYKRRIEIFYDGAPIIENKDWYNSIQAISWEAPAPNQQNSSMIYHTGEGFIEPNQNLINVNSSKWNKSQILSENGNEIIKNSLQNLTLEVKNTDKDIFLTTKIDHNINGKFNLSIKQMTLKVLGVDSSLIPKNLSATVKLSFWMDSGKQWSDSEGHSGDNWILIGNYHQSVKLKESQPIGNLSNIFSISRDHTKVMIGIGLIFDNENEDFLNFVEKNSNVSFQLLMDKKINQEDNIKFSIQSELYTKTIYPIKKDTGETSLNTCFDYSISSVWYRDRNNNTIRCRVTIDDKDYLLQEELRFGTKGSNGTNNTLILEMMDGKNALTLDGDKTLKVDAMLIKGDGRRIGLDKQQITWTLINNDQEYIKDITPSEGNNSFIVLGLAEKVKSVPSDNYTILKASVNYKSGNNVNPILEAFLPIPIRHSSCVGMSGTKEVIYNSQGIPPYGYETYIAYINKGNNSIEEKYNYSTSTNKKGWAIKQPQEKDKNGKNINPNPNPVALEILNGRVALKVSPLYSKKGNNKDSIQDKICVYYIDDSEKIVWSQPILIMQSSYDFAMLNSWDGSLTIDEENGTILATMLGAGRKNSQNEFSGVLLGDVETGTGNTAVKETGVFGFQNGTMTYALKEDGSGFFGANGNGRIEFDGNKGTISSAGWNQVGKKWQLSNTKTGSIFDFNDAKLRLQTAGGHYIDFNNAESGKLQMALSGLNVKLTDKSKNGGTLSGYIDATATGLISEFRRGATYTVTCSNKTDVEGVGRQYILNSTEFKQYDSSTTNIHNKIEYNYPITPLQVSDILKDGVTIAVTFTEEEIATSSTTEVEAVYDESSNTCNYVPITKSISGRLLYLSIDNISKPIYIDGEITGVGNPFSWSAGSVIYFTYKHKIETINNIATDKSYWQVSDSGSYSRISQTEQSILTEVNNVGEGLSSAITQTAKSIKLQVESSINYYGTCGSGDGNAIKTVVIKKGAVDNRMFKTGTTMSVLFSYGNSKKSNIYLNIKVLEDYHFNEKQEKANGFPVYYKKKPVSDKNPFTWSANSTIGFIFNKKENHPDGSINGYWEINETAAFDKINTLEINTKGITASSISRGGPYFAWFLDNNGFYLNGKNTGTVVADADNYIFKCDKDGIYVKGNGEFSGTITAKDGKIGDFLIQGNMLMTENYIQVKNGKVVIDSETQNPVYVTNNYKDGVYVGTDCIKLGKYFQVNSSGKMYAKRGQIGGIDIYTTHLGTSVGDSGTVWNGTLAEDMTLNDGKCMYIGTNGININNKFKVTSSGSVKISGSTTISGDATISGTVYASSIKGGKVNGTDYGTVNYNYLSCASDINFLKDLTKATTGSTGTTIYVGSIFSKVNGVSGTFSPMYITTGSGERIKVLGSNL